MTDNKDYEDNKDSEDTDTETEENFISLLSDTTFKYLYKKDRTRVIFNKMIKEITGINLDEYELYDNELNTGQKITMDYRLDILLRKNKDDIVSIEMNKMYNKAVMIKNRKYAYRLASNEDTEDNGYKTTMVRQINFNNAYADIKSHYNKEYKLQEVIYQKEELQDICFYEIFLSECKNRWYNGNKSMRLFALLASESFDEMREIAGDDREALIIMEEVKGLQYDKLFREAYNFEDIQKKLINGARSDGIEQGKKQGMKLGRENGIRDTAVEFLKNGIDKSIVSKCTGLSMKKINDLSKNI